MSFNIDQRLFRDNEKGQRVADIRRRRARLSHDHELVIDEGIFDGRDEGRLVGPSSEVAGIRSQNLDLTEVKNDLWCKARRYFEEKSLGPVMPLDDLTWEETQVEKPVA